MGNSTSNASNPRAIRGASPTPYPGNPHPSLRTKKKSLELPDLASLSPDNTRGRQAKTASIPIPTTPPSPFNHYQQPQQTQRAPRHLPSTADVNLVVPQHQNHPPFPPRQNPSLPRGRQQPISTRQQQQVARMQELYNQSLQPAHSPSSRQLPFHQEIVRSSIPIALNKALLPDETPLQDQIVPQDYPQKEDLLADCVPFKMVWTGGGSQVVLARAGDNDWKGRQLMEKESANVWSVTVMLRPGTHHVRFLVDGQWRVADDLPTAVDDQGSLANYIAIPIPTTPAPLPAITRDKLVPGQSFWSADSADGESEQSKQQQTSSTHTHSQSNWTNVLPLELIEAAREEEAYLAASAGQYDSNTRVTTGFVPAPNIPPAPGLPRHLEKLILNTRVGATTTAAGSPNSGVTGGGTTRPRLGQVMGGMGSMGIGSGQGQAARKERDRERRDGDKRERDRERERGERAMRKRATTAAAASAVMNIPPPPPPTEVGEPSSWVASNTRIVATTSLPETSLIGTTAVESSLGGASTTSLTSTPAISSPTPTTPVSNENGTATEMSPTMSPTTTATTTLPTSTTSSTTTSATTSPNPNNNSPTTTTLIPPSTSTTHSMPAGSRTITIDGSNMPSLSDDGSVLPVPSHVVLHHLSTSAIRNGVLAVGNTIRYRKKYLTTIYYKPT